MKTIPGRQRGGSAIATIVLLLALGYGIFVGIQYVPQYLEAVTIESILDSVESDHHVEPVGSLHELENAINKQLEVNQMNDLRDAFNYSQRSNHYTVEISYERELNLLYEKKKIAYHKTRTLQ